MYICIYIYILYTSCNRPARYPDRITKPDTEVPIVTAACCRATRGRQLSRLIPTYTTRGTSYTTNTTSSPVSWIQRCLSIVTKQNCPTKRHSENSDPIFCKVIIQLFMTIILLLIQ